jgi:phosphoesterase RecJ-like protein
MNQRKSRENLEIPASVPENHRMSPGTEPRAGVNLPRDTASRENALKDAVSGREMGEALAGLAERVLRGRTFLVASHVNPDGDALGSAAALTLALRGLGKEARAVAAKPLPERYRPFFAEDVVTPFQSEDAGAIADLVPVDVCVLLDTSEPERAGSFRNVIFRPGQARICLDHHIARPPLSFDDHLVLTEAPATGSLVLALLDRLGASLTSEIAQALWIAIATDTGWFRFPNATPWAFRDASRLSACGLNLESLYDRIYQDSPLARTLVLGDVLARTRSELGGRFLWSFLEQSAMRERGVGIEDLDGIVDALKAVRGAEVMALIVEREPGRYKVSLRARGPADVQRVASSFGGGGHSKASGCRYEGTFEDLLAQLLARVRRELESRGSGAG